MGKLGLVLVVVLAAACGGGDDDGDGTGDADASAQGDPDAGGGDGSLMVTNSSAITIAELYVDDSDDYLAEHGALAPDDSVTLQGITCADHEVLLIDDTDVGCLIAAIELCDAWVINSDTYDLCEI
jgi:hypothetical protein